MCESKKYTGTLTCQKCQQKNNVYFCDVKKQYEFIQDEVSGWVLWFTCPECGEVNSEDNVENLKEATEAPWEEE